MLFFKLKKQDVNLMGEKEAELIYQKKNIEREIKINDFLHSDFFSAQVVIF